MTNTMNNNSIVKYFWKEERFWLLLLAASLLLAIQYPAAITGVTFLFVLVKYKSIPSYGGFENVCLYLTFVSFFLIYTIVHSNTFYWGLYYGATPIFMYMIGKYLASKWYDDSCILIIMLLMAVGLGFPHLVVTISDIFVNGLINPQRSLAILADGEDVAVTLRTVALSLCPFGFALLLYKPISTTQNKIKSVFFILGILSFFCFLHYVSRTGIALTVVMTLLGLVVTRTGRSRTLGILLMILALVYIIMNLTVTNEFVDLYTERQSVDSSLLEAGGRSQRWLMALDNLSEYPLGGINNSYLAHNLWLDTGRMVGIFPFFFLVLFSLSNIVKTTRTTMSKQSTQLMKIMIAGFSFLFLMSNFTECTIVGLQCYVFVYIMFCGMIKTISEKQKLRR